MNIMERAKTVAETAMDVSTGGFAKLTDLLDEYKTRLELLGKFGFTLSEFEFDAGVLTEILTSISGSVANIGDAEIRQIAEAHSDQKLTAAVLNTLSNANG